MCDYNSIEPKESNMTELEKLLLTKEHFPDVPLLPKEILNAPPLEGDEPILGRQYTVSREEAEASMKEDEVSHTFIKVSHQDYATCEDCGSRVQFYSNPTAHAEMIAHRCSLTGDV